MTVKPGWQTTEWWATLATALASLLGLVVPAVAGTQVQTALQIALAAVGGLVVAIYTAIRGHVKAAALNTNPARAPPPPVPPGAPVPPPV